MNFNVFFLLFAVLFAFISTTFAYPSEVIDEEPLEVVHLRVRRATCDLFSFSSKWVTPNHAACAAHCIALGKRGGRCKDTICHCRN